MTRRRTVLDRLSDRVMDLDSPAYGDERERAVFMEASSFGLTTGLLAGVLGASVSALFGLVLLPIALLVVTLLPAGAAVWYAKRRGVDLQELADRAGARSTLVYAFVLGGGAVLTFAAMTWTVFTGEGLIPPPSVDVVPGEGFLGGMAQGAVIGGVLGGLAAIVGTVLARRKAGRGPAAGDRGARAGS